ncbi:MAG: IS6 family transposase, partial [Phenylobacterium sp.]|nr:IS6 family transposase [Phenylobacterium sp.]MCA6327943.1 IS6 family transposase [Phenylobacterium sp.]
MIKFGPLIAANLCRRGSSPTERWRLDEMYVRIGGWKMWLWRTINDEGEIVDVLGQAGWSVNAKRVQRIWRREGLKVPQKQPKRGRLWLNDGSCVRLRAERSNHVWSYDFVEDRTHDGRKF